MINIEPATFARAEAAEDMETWSVEVVDLAIRRQIEGNYQKALEATKVIPPETSVYDVAQQVRLLAQTDRILNAGNLFQQSISGNILALLEAQALAESFTNDHPLYALAQERIPLWQEHLQDLYQLQIASFVADLGQPFALNLAASQVAAIDDSRPRRIHAQTLLAHWRNEVQRVSDRPYLRRAQRLAELNTIEGHQAAHHPSS